MDTLNFIWLIAFSVLLLKLNILCSLITKYIDDKPLGHQSLYDVVLRDNLNIAKLYGTTYCLLAILSRFNCLTETLGQNLLLGNIACLFYSFTFTATCVNLGCMCIIRTLCLINISWMEENLGEMCIRFTLMFITLIISITACTIQIISGDITTGTIYILLTGQTVPVGKSQTLQNLNLTQHNKRIYIEDLMSGSPPKNGSSQYQTFLSLLFVWFY